MSSRICIQSILGLVNCSQHAFYLSVEMMFEKSKVNDPGCKSGLTDHPLSTDHYTYRGNACVGAVWYDRAIAFQCIRNRSSPRQLMGVRIAGSLFLP